MSWAWALALKASTRAEANGENFRAFMCMSFRAVVAMAGRLAEFKILDPACFPDPEDFVPVNERYTVRAVLRDVAG